MSEPTIRERILSLPKQLDLDLNRLHEEARKVLGPEKVSISYEDFLVGAIITGARLMVAHVQSEAAKTAPVIIAPGNALDKLPPMEKPNG
jgi:hypothetical protein